MLSVGIALVIFAVCLCLLQFWKTREAAGRLPPGPFPLPFLGNLLTLDLKHFHIELIQLAKQYGNTYTVWMGQSPVVVLNGLAAVKDALISHSEEFSGRPEFPSFTDFSRQKGIATSNNHTWKQQRRFGMMTLRNLGLGKRTLESQIFQEARHMVDSFASEKGQPWNPSDLIVNSVSNVICAVVFGKRFNYDDETFHKLTESVNYTINFNARPLGRIYDAFPNMMRHIPGPHQEMFKHWGRLNDFIKEEVKKHQENWQVNKEPQDFIDYYLTQIAKTKDDLSSTFDESNLIQSVIDLFMAGTETTTTTLRWALLYMVAHPDVQERVQAELNSVLGQSRLPQYEDRDSLPYTNAVIHEIQRYGSIVAPGVFRECVKNTTVQGFPISKGTIILPNLPSVLYDPEHWETPQDFNPNHFLDKNGQFVKKEAFLPFSAGHRVCLGENLAKVELFIFFTHLLQAFNFRLPDGVKDVNMQYILGITLCPHPYQICAIPH